VVVALVPERATVAKVAPPALNSIDPVAPDVTLAVSVMLWPAVRVELEVIEAPPAVALSEVLETP
jgi:hypothetical protein